MKNKQSLPIDCTSDNHIHTRYCRHATGTMENYVQSAIRKGLHKITFLEHMEIGINYFEKVWLEDDDFDKYFRQGEHLKEKYKDQLTIGIGVEVGYNPNYKEELLKSLGRRTWDLIGLSYHFSHIAQLKYHINLVSRKRENTKLFTKIGSRKLLDDYFTNLIEAVDIVPAHFLCHLDAGLRFSPNLTLSENNWRQINTLLIAIKHKEMALEINTSGFTIRGESFPAKRIIQMAKNYAIPFIAGSDAHKPEDVGRFFNRLPFLMEEL